MFLPLLPPQDHKVHSPNCVAKVFMIRRHTTVSSGSCPSEANMGAARATGVPKPLAPAGSSSRQQYQAATASSRSRQ